MTKSSPYIVTKGLREPLEEEVEPTPQEKYDHAMELLDDYGYACVNLELDDQLKAHKALSDLFADIYKLDEQ